jgi:hypothetical protein
MAKFSQKLMGKEVGSAAVYAEPHTMSGGKVSLKSAGYEGGDRAKVGDDSVSVGAYRSKPYADVKTSGIKMRGAGAATKGYTSRGPMA